ncbi:hypothetical protein [Micromonospora sp. NPDC049240]|uniref:hypothetical protein n=1 Tax=Micromonospora sp. NPDC049240 TaxID=3155151 RepID=UPI0033D9C7BA
MARITLPVKPGTGGTGGSGLGLPATSVQVVNLNATTTWYRATVAYSQADSNVDQIQFFAGNPGGGAALKITWWNGNNELRNAASTDQRVAHRVYEVHESAGQGRSKKLVWEVSTNPADPALRTTIAGVYGTGHATMPGYLVAPFGIDAPNLKPTAYQALTLGSGITASGDPYESPGARGEYPDITRLCGSIEIPANTSAGSTLFTVPTGLRPLTKTKKISVRTTGSNIATVLFINTAGQASFNISSGASAGQLGLDDITFSR